ncbi:MAG: hypothetical protein NZM07_08595 [Elioraea sp.]|nr:hypothetical protein [Elioraea sp.]
MTGTESEASLTTGDFAAERPGRPIASPASDPSASWAADEALLCADLVRQGQDGRAIGPLIVAVLRATDALAQTPLPAEVRAALEASAWEALRTLARTDGRQRRRDRRPA